jgi:predicted ribosomally synthesized peptide with nif11-like leader
LHYALATTAPDAVVEIAKNKGYKFSKDELSQIVAAGDPAAGKLSDEHLAQASGGALSFYSSLGKRALSTSLWSRLSLADTTTSGGFQLTIPGPSFVNVMSSQPRDESEAAAAAERSTPSATDLYDSLGS